MYRVTTTACTGGKEMSIASSLDRADDWLLSHLCDMRLLSLSQKEELTSNDKAEIELIKDLNMRLICNSQKKEVKTVDVCASDLTEGLLSNAYSNTVDMKSEEAWYATLLKRTLDVIDGVPYVGNISVFIESDNVCITLMGHIRHDNDLDCNLYEISFENLGGCEDIAIFVEGVDISFPEYLTFIKEELPDILKKSL